MTLYTSTGYTDNFPFKCCLKEYVDSNAHRLSIFENLVITVATCYILNDMFYVYIGVCSCMLKSSYWCLLILIDAYSKWPEVHAMSSTSV